MSFLDPFESQSSRIAPVDKDWTVHEIAQMSQINKRVLSKTVHSMPGVFETPSTVERAEVIADVSLTPSSPTRFVSGLYRGTSGNFQLDLRVDVDGRHPTLRISGDVFRVAGATVTYFGSFIVNNPEVSASHAAASIKGQAIFSFSTTFPLVNVTIPLVTMIAPPAAAKTIFMNDAGSIGNTFECAFLSPHFRTVQYEEDIVEGTKAFESYNTASLPSAGPARTLSVITAYAEAGIEVQVAGISSVLNPFGAGTDRKWSNAELHATMVDQFNLWKDQPQWKVWLMVATDHETENLRGIMFDQQSNQRQGCAVFYDRIKGDDNASRRAALRTYVHELGHCFNLLHSWQKSFAVPPQPNRNDALSWMNYVQNFPGGETAYWSAFPFQFDDPELVHLRHAFRDNIIMGGNQFTVGAAEFDIQPFFNPIVDNSGLKLELRIPEGKSFLQCEPVVVELKLSTTDLRGKRVHTRIHPNYGFVQIGIQMPGGAVNAYKPLIEQCIETETIVLDEKNPSIYASAYIGYGKKGFYFDQSGLYKLRAVYHALDGSEVLSNILVIRVRDPLDKTEEKIADAYSGTNQGILFYVLGSDSEQLASGTKAFENVIDKHGNHPMAVYAHLVTGMNAGRTFKTITADKKLHNRAPQTDNAIQLLNSAVDMTIKGDKTEGLDHITLEMVMRRLARALGKRGDEKGVNRTLNQLVGYFRDKEKIRKHVVERIQDRTDLLHQEILKDTASRPKRKARKPKA